MASSYLSNHFRCAEVCGETAYLACLRQMITSVQFDHLKSMPNKHWFPNTNFEFVLFIGRWKDDQIIAKEGAAVECAKTVIWSSRKKQETQTRRQSAPGSDFVALVEWA